MCLAWLERCPRRHLFLHVDINRTIIQVDAAGGRTFDDVLHSNAAANVMGVVDARGQWLPLHGPHDTTRHHTTAAATTMTTAATSSSSELLSYDAYVDRIHGAPDGMSQLSPLRQREVWRGVTAARRAATRTFALPGHVGHAYAHLVDEQRRCLRVDNTHDKGSSSNSGDDGDGDAGAATYHSIVPSFFALVNTLSCLDWPFTLLFRTFGSDMASVLAEWRRFVCGEHVCQPRGPVLQRMRQAYATASGDAAAAAAVLPRSACVYRAHDKVYLCYGPTVSAAAHVTATLSEEDNDHSSRRNNNSDKKDDDDESDDSDSARVLAALRCMPHCHAVEEVSLRTFHARLRAYVTPSHGVGGVVDYYPYWAQGAERRSGGKLFPVDVYAHTTMATPPSSSSLQQQQQQQQEDEGERCYYVFFDDNIALGDAHSIVDVRDARSGQSICDAAVERAYCVPVNAYKAIVQRDYFVEALCHCLQQQQQ